MIRDHGAVADAVPLPQSPVVLCKRICQKGNQKSQVGLMLKDQ
jgi:hypothetical protein